MYICNQAQVVVQLQTRGLMCYKSKSCQQKQITLAFKKSGGLFYVVAAIVLQK